jgi:hypothetical protein
MGLLELKKERIAVEQKFVGNEVEKFRIASDPAAC